MTAKNVTRRDKRSQRRETRTERNNIFVASQVLVACIWYKELLSRSRVVYLLYPFAGNIVAHGSFRSASRMGKYDRRTVHVPYSHLCETRIKCRDPRGAIVTVPGHFSCSRFSGITVPRTATATACGACFAKNGRNALNMSVTMQRAIEVPRHTSTKL